MNTAQWQGKGRKRAVQVELVEQRRAKTKVRVLEGRSKGRELIVPNQELGLPVLPEAPWPA